MRRNVYKFPKIFVVFFLVLATVAVLFPPLHMLADTTVILRPTADGGNDSVKWAISAGTKCDATNCYTEVYESSGGNCTNSDGDSSYISATDAASIQTFDVDESSIPDNSTITAINISVCYKNGTAGQTNTFQTRRCVNGSCADSGTDITIGDSYTESTQSHSGLSVTKNASTDIEIGVGITGSSKRQTRVSQISAVITYTPPSDTTAPSAVNNLAASNPAATTIDLAWTSPGDDAGVGTAASYDIRYSTAAIDEGNWSSATQVSGEPAPQAAGASQSITVTGLTAGTTYYFAMKTSDEVPNASAISNVPSATTVAPSSLSATASVDTHWVKGGTSGQNFIFTITNSATSTKTIQWVKFTRPSAKYTPTAGSASGWSAAVAGATITFTGGSITIGGSGTFTVTSDVTSGDEAQTAWTVSVDNDSAGKSPVSAAASSAGALDTGVDSTAPTGAGVNSVTVNSSSKLTANAATAVDSASGLASSSNWFDETSGGPGANDSTVWQSELTFEDTGLTASTQYCYRAKAKDAVGNESAFSTATCGTTASASSSDSTAPSAVANLSASGVSGSSISLAWTSPGDDADVGTAASYDVRYGTSAINDSNWASSTQATGEPTPAVAGSSESFTVSGLSQSTTYYFALKTSDEAPNVSALSNVVSTTTTSGADVTPPVISGIALSGVTQTSAVISWSTNELADSQVEYGTTPGFGSQSTLNASLVSAHSVTLSGLSAGTTYYYRIKTRDAAGNLATSDTLIFSTSAASTGDGGTTVGSVVAVPRISEVLVSTTSETSATITWKTDQQSTSRVDYVLAAAGSQGTAIGTPNTSLVYEHKFTIIDLKPDTHYRFQAYSENSNQRGVTSEYYEFTTNKPKPKPKPPAPVISEIKVVSVRPTLAKITWKTNIPATSQIRFGVETEALNQVTIELSTIVTDHAMTISDLSPKTAYFFKTISRSAEEIEGMSEEKTFTTESVEIQTVVEIKKSEAMAPGSPGTQIPKIAVGETVTLIPILPTPKDISSPKVTLFKFKENPTKNTSPIIQGSANDSGGVIAGLSYSTDGGGSWHPVSDVTGIGSSVASFSAKIPNLQAGSYPILFRVRDNSGNIGKSEARTLVVAIEPPATGANVLLLGTQSVFPSAFGNITTLTGINQRLVTSAIGGVINVDIIATRTNTKPSAYEEKNNAPNQPRVGGGFLSANTALAAAGTINQKISTSSPKNSAVPAKASSSEISFPLNYSKAADLWFGDVSFAEPGNYQLQIKAVDGVGRVSLRTINPITVVEPGLIVNTDTGKAISGAKITVFQFSPEINDFILWPAEVFNQANPQFTGKDGSFRFILPPGKYYLKVEKEGYRTFYTDINEFSSHTAINFRLPVAPSSKLRLPFSIFGIKEIPLPTLPDFWGMERVKGMRQGATPPPESVGAMLGKPAPVFALPDSSGKIVDLRYLRGKKTILTIWATWAPLAQVQLPILDKLQKENSQNIRVLLLSLQESQGVVESYLRRGGYELQSVIDRDGQITKPYPIFTMPEHFFIDRRGVVRDVFIGFLSDQELQEKLEKL